MDGAKIQGSITKIDPDNAFSFVPPPGGFLCKKSMLKYWQTRQNEREKMTKSLVSQTGLKALFGVLFSCEERSFYGKR